MDQATTGFVRRLTLISGPSALGELLDRVCLCDARYRQRRALEALDAVRRADLGLSKHDIEAELRKPVWRA